MNPIVKLSRRDFVKTTGLLVLGVSQLGLEGQTSSK